jgi:hypothetical protein
MRWSVFVTLLLFGIGTARGQSQKPLTKPPSTSDPATLKEIESLKSEVARLEAQLTESKTTIKDLTSRLVTLEIWKITQDNHTVALDLSSTNFQRLETDSGTFLVSVENATPYLDGFRLDLSIGNPSSVTYSGFKIHVKWNSRYDYDHFSEPGYSNWQKAQREKDDSFVDRLPPGSWHKISIVLPATAADQLGFLILSMETNTVSLRTE